MLEQWETYKIGCQSISPKSGNVFEDFLIGKRWRSELRKYCPIVYCEVCNKRLIKKQWLVDWVTDINEDPRGCVGQNKLLCFGCYNKNLAIKRKWRALEEMRLQINRCKKQLQRKHNEST